MIKLISGFSSLFITLLLSLLSFTVSASVDDAGSWAQVSLPVDGKAGNWVLAGGSDLKCLTQARDGTLYCYVISTETPYTLFKSENSGKGWRYTGEVKDAIVEITTPPDDPSVVYYTTTYTVYKSTDAGTSFSPVLYYPGGAGTGNIEITAIDVINHAGHYLIAVATKDTDAGQFGGVYLYDESDPDPVNSWVDTGIGSYDVYDVAFSPSPIVGQWHLAAVANDEIITVIKTRIGETAWGSMLSDTVIPLAGLNGACIAFPDNYGRSQQDFTLLAGLDTGTGSGDVYVIYSGVAPAPSSWVDFDIGRPAGLSNVDVKSMAVTGDSRTAVIIAASDKADVFMTRDGGATWTRSPKPPTGAVVTGIIPSADFAATNMVYAVSSGPGSAFTISTDCGFTWNQRSLIDTKISALVDFAVSPDYDQDGTIFLLTFGGGKHSLWRTGDGGNSWDKIFGSTLSGVDGIDYVRLSPEYGRNGRVVFLTGTSGGKPVLWKSADNGNEFTKPRPAYDPVSGASFMILQCTVIDNNTLLCGTFNGVNGLVYITADSGWTYTNKLTAGSALPNSIGISPDFTNDKTILIGDTAGGIFISDDSGASFKPLPDISTSPLSGKVAVAFDPGFNHNRTVYAVGDVPGTGIFRYVVGHSVEWENIDATLPAGSLLNQVVLSAKGTLYAANGKIGMGVERSLEPTDFAPVFETVDRNLGSDARLTGLHISGSRLWSMDTASSRLVVLADTLASPVTLTAPVDKAAGIGPQNIKLDWEPLDGASTYEWQLDTDTEFTTVPAGFDDTTRSTSAILSGLETGTTYYWRVRVITPAMSPWSVRRSFTTTLSGSVNAPQLNSPAAGAIVSVKPVFQWEPVAGADSYELLIDASYSFTDPVVDRSGSGSLPTTAWQCDTTLSPGTTYYWKIRAINSRSFSDWSNTGVFTTEAALPTTASPAAEPPLSTMSIVNINPVTTTVTITEALPTAVPTPVTTMTTQLIQMQQTAQDWLRPLLYIGGGLILIIVIATMILIIAVIRMGSRY